MSDNNDRKNQRDYQKELIELKLKKQAFMENPDAFVPEGPAPNPVLTKSQKLKNFWHYSKYAIAFAVVVAIIFSIAFVQCAGRKKYDMTIVVRFNYFIGSSMIENIGLVAEQYCEDYNGDGEINVLVMDCTLSDNEGNPDVRNSKQTRLMAQFASSESIVYIVDEKSLGELDTLAGGIFVDDSLDLPMHDGKAFPLNGTAFDQAFNAVSEDYADEFEYYMIRRVVDGTAIENKKNVSEYSKEADKFIKAVMGNPNLEGVDLKLPDAAGNIN